jgi:hypothetical protein
MAERNPLVWMVEVNGLLVDAAHVARGSGDCLRKRIGSLYSGGSAKTIVNGTIPMEEPSLASLRKETVRANAMARTRYQSDRSSGKTTQKNISEKLRDIATDIKEHGHANLTRLTVLKKWFEAPGRIMSFGAFIAIQASQPTRKTTKKAEQLLCEAREILAEVDLFVPKIPNDRAKRLHARLEAFQGERRDTRRASVRIIHNRDLFLVEGGLGLYLWYRNSPSQAYQLAASYCEHYDPRFGDGLSGPSVKRIQEIADFTLAVETHESGEASA